MKTICLFLMLFLFGTTLTYAQSKESELKEIALQMDDEATGKYMIERLKPSLDDFQKIFVSTQDVQDAWIYCEYLDEITVDPAEGQSELKVYKLTGAELKANVESNLPDKYYKIADHVKDDVIIYAVEYVKPGEESGYMLDAFFFVREHWVFIPNAYEIFE